MDVSFFDPITMRYRTTITPITDPTEIFLRALETGDTDEFVNLVGQGLFDVNIWINTRDREDHAPRLFPIAGTSSPRRMFNKLAPPLIYAIRAGHRAIISLLIEKGANVNVIVHDYAETPLMLAAENGDIWTVKLLLKSGANLTVKDTYGSSVLSRCINLYTSKLKYCTGSSGAPRLLCLRKIVEVILSFVIDMPKTKNWKMSLFKDYCIIFKMLIDNDKVGILQVINDIKDLTFPEIGEQYTPLKFILNIGDTDMLKILINHGKHLKEILFACTRRRKLELLEYLFLETDVDFDCQDTNGNTPLHHLVFPESCLTTAMLLEIGTDVTLRNNKGLQPTHKCSNKDKCYVKDYYCKIKYIDEEYVKKGVKIMLNYKDSSVLDLDRDSEMLCKQEIDTMKSTILCHRLLSKSSVSLYDYLFIDRQRSCRLARNEHLKRIYEECNHDFKRTFSHFGALLNYRYRKGLKRRKLLESAHEALETVIGTGFPEILSNDIFKYLSNSQLQELSTVT